MSRVWLKKNREKSVKMHHPWIFSSAVEKTDSNNICPGDVVHIVDHKGNFLAWGYWSPNSQIQVRILDWDESAKIDENWWWKHLNNAFENRRNLNLDIKTNAYRLVHAEADMLPGLIIDKYNDYIVVQLLTAGINKIKDQLVQQIMTLINPTGIFERSDSDVRKIEGLPLTRGLVAGKCPEKFIEIKENEFSFIVDIKEGQKTGFFLDQRINREIVAEYAQNRIVLDCFSYTGGFSVYASGKKAEKVICIDSSSSALNIAQENFKLNSLSSSIEILEGNAFEILRKYRDRGQFFDMIILDPPKLAPTKAHSARAQRAYKDINLLAIKLLKPNGILATFSCSGGIDIEFFKEIVFWASLDASREVQVLKVLSGAEDHPIRLSFPESEYLKGLICRVI